MQLGGQYLRVLMDNIKEKPIRKIEKKKKKKLNLGNWTMGASPVLSAFKTGNEETQSLGISTSLPLQKYVQK